MDKNKFYDEEGNELDLSGTALRKQDELEAKRRPKSKKKPKTKNKGKE